MVRWIFFDLGSTLLDEELAYKIYVKSCVDKLSLLGQSVSIADYQDRMKDYASKGLDPIKDTWSFFASNKCRPLWTNEGVIPYPEAKEVLEHLYQHYQLRIIANQSGDVRILLEKWGLADYFQLIILSKEVGLSKPDLRIFHHALEKAVVPATETIYVGDRYDNDVLPAKSVGMKTVRLLTGFGRFLTEEEGVESDWKIESLQELPELLGREES